MERVEALIDRLKAQFEQGADSAELLTTVRQIQNELTQLQPKSQRTLGTSKVAVMMPAGMGASAENFERYGPRPVAAPAERVKEVKETVVFEDEAPVSIVQQNGQLDMVFDPMTEIPTLSHQVIEKKPTRVNGSGPEPESLNDKLKQTKIELVEVLKETPIKDLRKAIGINDRFVFIDELFRGDVAMYERSIKTINSFNIYAEAEYWIARELKTKLGWDNDNAMVHHFDQLVRRRFS